MLRDADIFVAGNAFGTMFMEVRRFGLVITADEIVTVRKSGSQHEAVELLGGRYTGQSGRKAHLVSRGQHCTDRVPLLS